VEQRVNITVAHSVCVCVYVYVCVCVCVYVCVTHCRISVAKNGRETSVIFCVSLIKSLRLRSLRLHDIPFLNIVFRLLSYLHIAAFEGSITKTTVQVALCVCVQVSSVGVCSVVHSARVS